MLIVMKVDVFWDMTSYTLVYVSGRSFETSLHIYPTVRRPFQEHNLNYLVTDY
jgi:hypothetical protein